MTSQRLAADPYNLIITGVGGQGTVLASRIVGNMLTRKGYYVTIGETFGASQRGGSVMSHLRISADDNLSPQTPKGKGRMVVALEPTEALRVLKEYGAPHVKVVTNTRPVFPLGVISGESSYPSIEDLRAWMETLTAALWFIDATEEAVKLGNPILGNIILVGALAAVGDLPMDRECFRTVLAETMSSSKLDINMTAFDKGMEAVRPCTAHHGHF